MSPVISADRPLLSRPRLRVLPRPAHATDAHPAPAVEREPQSAVSSVLVAGANAHRREQMLGELRGLLPKDTDFVEARETWQVLAKAPDSGMVVLTGDLGDISAQGLMRVLSRRYPLLPVIALGSHRRSPAPANLDAASL